MDIDKIKLNTVIKYNSQRDIEKIRSFLEKKHCGQIFFTKFRENSILFFQHDKQNKNIVTIDKEKIIEKDIGEQIVNYEIYLEDESIREKLVHGAYYENSNIEIMRIKIRKDVLQKEKFRDLLFTLAKNRDSDNDIELTLLDYVSFYYPKSIKDDKTYLSSIISSFLQIFSFQHSKSVEYFFSEDYFLSYRNV